MNKKKGIILVFSILLAIVASLNFSVAIKAREYTTYEIEVAKESPITGITINNTSIDLTRYVNDDIEIKDDKLCAKNKGTITIMTSVIDNIFIKYDNDAKNMNVYKDGIKLESEDTLFMCSSNILQDINSSISKYTIILFIAFIPLFYLLLWYIVSVIKSIKEGKLKIYNIIFATFAIFTTYFCTFYILLYGMRQFVVIIPMICMGVILWYLKDTFVDKKENLYLSIVMIAGITMLYIVPPFNVPDEKAHFIKSYYMTVLDKKGEGYENYPTSIDNFAYKYVQGMHNIGTNYNVKNYFSDILENGDYSVKNDYESKYTNTSNLSIVPYIPSSIVIGIGRLLNLSPLLLILLAKITDLTLTIVLGYIALKNVPRFKNIFLIILLLPMTLHQAAAVNMDFLTNIIAITFTAFILKYKEQEVKLSVKNKIVLFGLALVLAYCKFGYFPFFLLILLIPNDKFNSKKEAIIYKISLIAIPLILSYLKNTGFGTGDKPYYTLSFMFTHPFKVLQIFYNTAVERLSLDLFTGQFDGFGVSTRWLPSLYTNILMFIFAILYLTSGNDEKLEVKERITFLIIGALIIGAVYSGLLVGWTPVGAMTVQGLQPRYFLPAVFLILIGCSNNFIKLNVKDKNKFLSCTLFVIYTISLYFIVKGFY